MAIDIQEGIAILRTEISIKSLLRKVWDAATHIYGRLSRKYYFEDFVRVYPDGLDFDRLGRQRKHAPDAIKNYLNHQKFYRFTAQFVSGMRVADIGCGSGYGCRILKESGAASVWGADVSEKAVAFARERFGIFADFSVQSITSLNDYANRNFDVAISSEVLEHIKEYGKEDLAVSEVKRVTRPGGIVIFSTPNSELLADHGFTFEGIDALMKRHFNQYCIFENALVPFGRSRSRWEQRLTRKQTGIIVTQTINLDETVLPEGIAPETKQGQKAGTFWLGNLAIDTRLLHNTHSWVIVAKKDEEPR